MADFDLFRSLWTNINDATVPKQPPGQPPKAILLMEMPGFTVDPESYNTSIGKEFNDQKRHPDRAVAMLADRVPALAPYFYDTGSTISFYWDQLLSTFKLRYNPEDDPKLKEKYDEAIKMLYGSKEGYKQLKKSKIFENREVLRQNWLDAKEEERKFWLDCKEKPGWPQNFQSHAGPYVDKKNQAYTEYDNIKSQIEQYEAAIFQYTRGDLSRLMLYQEQGISCSYSLIHDICFRG